MTSQRINVLQILGNAITGGMENCVLRLIERLPKDRFHIAAITPFESAITEKMRALDVDVIALPMIDEPPWSSIHIAATLVKAQAIDVLHAHLPNGHILAGIAGRITGKPVLATLHGRNLEATDFEVHRLTGTHVSAVCKHTFFQALGLGVDPSRLHLIPNGVDSEVFKPLPDSGALRERHRIPTSAPLIGFVGRLAQEKGPSVFVQAALHVHRCMPAARFVMIGEGPLRGEIEGLIARFDMDYVHLAGLQHDMPNVYAELDLVVSTSHSEAMPLVLMEAMACGVPVIATRIGGVPDIVLHSVTGILVSPNDDEAIARAILDLLKERSKYCESSAAARQRAVERFSLNDSVEATAQLLTRLAQPRGTDRRLSTLPVAKQASAAAPAANGKSLR